MEIYDHFTYGEAIARRLKSIAHTDEYPKFFTAFGLEDLATLDDKLSSVTGTILIAVNGYESDSDDNGYDYLRDRTAYSFIIAQNTVADRSDTINQAAANSRVIAKQIRNHLLCDITLKDVIERNTEINGIGPIGDNFYGVILTIHFAIPEDYFIDPTYWKE